MTVITWAAAFLTGLLSSLGVGGGMVLIVWLTAVMGMPQLEAQGINLIFFLPIALLAVIIHRKNHLISIKELVPALITGIAGAAAGCWGARLIGSELLGKIYAAFILVIGIRELYSAIFGNNRE